MSLKFGINLQKKPNPGLQKPLSTKGKPAFGADSDEEDSGAAKNDDEVEGFTINQLGSSKRTAAVEATVPKLAAKPKRQLVSQYGDLSSQKTHHKNAEKALEIDASIYDYDAAYDAIHAKEAAKKAARKAEAEERKSKYVDNLMASAEVRKRDLLRAKDKQLQRERETEGDMYADKEKFVTGAYKQQQEEVRKAEEEEKRRQEQEEKKRKELGMQGFYRSVMDDQEKRYQEAVTATAEAEKTGVSVAEEGREKTDREIAEEMKVKGADVILNDQGEIVDKRQLLSAGLNVMKKTKPATTSAVPSQSMPSRPAYQGKTTNQQSMRERQTRMLEAQLEQAAKRAADEEAEEQRKLEHNAKSRKTGGDLSGARERYLARKKAAEEAKKNAK